MRREKFICADDGSGLRGSNGHVPILAENMPPRHQSKNSQILLTVFYNSDVQNPARLFKNLEMPRATLHLMLVTLVGIALVKIKGMALFLL